MARRVRRRLRLAPLRRCPPGALSASRRAAREPGRAFALAPGAAVTPRDRVPLGPYCTMGVGGPARFFVEAREEADVLDAFEWARRTGTALRVLGGGSNVVVADEGVDALVVRVALRGLSAEREGTTVDVCASAGEPWDGLVRQTVERGWAGVECLSGIPGLVGATPIQNVGAYGQEVSDAITEVRALDRLEGRVVTLTAAECGFGYRDSMLKRTAPDRYVVLGVTYRLMPGGAPRVRYADLERHLEARGIGSPSLADVRESVLAVRRTKSMVLDPTDPNRRSCGSFFLNPIVSREAVPAIESRAGDPGMPRWEQPDGRVKLSAAWLIERAGFARGHRDGPVGLSTRHSLAIVCHDGARARDVVAFASRIRDRVQDRFGVRLVPEPALWGLPLP
jgi:UDP-N-acetylmuramate dehydrogenase